VPPISGFPPISNKQAKVLILGSMPSEISILKQQYYGHQRNAFWPIMLSLFSQSADFDKTAYSQRKQLLIKNNIAVWDVLQSCYREGSLDAAIKMNSIKTNDFKTFYSMHTNIVKICFNGAKAEAVYNKHVLPLVKNQFSHLEYIKLPSTSPAYAAMTIQQKIAIWSNSLSASCRV
jgi:hypoxanthine-DNA glycosylase